MQACNVSHFILGQTALIADTSKHW